MGAPNRPVKVILDTCVAIWLDNDFSKISPNARDHLSDRGTECTISVVSVWEMEVKSAIGKLPIQMPIDQAIDILVDRYGLSVLNLDRYACHQLPKIESVRGDPFDRMLVCQCIAEGVPLVTPDPHFRAYPIRTIW